MITKEELSKQLKESVDWLWKNKQGCSHWHLLTDECGREWSIVLGWSDGFDDSDNDRYFVDEGMAICSEIGYQEENTYMQTDMDIDFLQPYDKKTGDVDDTNCAVSRNEDYDELAASLLKTFKRVVSDWATFDDESYSYLKEIES